jgi:hypothetical protein
MGAGKDDLNAHSSIDIVVKNGHADPIQDFVYGNIDLTTSQFAWHR